MSGVCLERSEPSRPRLPVPDGAGPPSLVYLTTDPRTTGELPEMFGPALDQTRRRTSRS